MRSLRATLVLWLVATLVWALPSLAAIPGPEKVARAVANANEVSGRSKPLLIEVTLRVAGAAPSADGTLAVHPSGLARLELRNKLGFVERHLLQGNAYQASRDGQLLRNPHPFLPPVFLLQATSGEALRAALGSFGVADQELVLGRLGRHDCYVFGGRIPGSAPKEQLLPSLWVDTVSFDPLRIVRADGVEYRLGPIEVHSGIRLPKWIELRTPAGFRARLEVAGVSRAEAPAALFQPDWLTATPGPAKNAAP
ncbi:MAG: hypothetical protein AAF430_06890 [Myxococcota bacterium]